jgi:hypothetical protein
MDINLKDYKCSMKNKELQHLKNLRGYDNSPFRGIFSFMLFSIICDKKINPK